MTRLPATTIDEQNLYCDCQGRRASYGEPLNPSAIRRAVIAHRLAIGSPVRNASKSQRFCVHAGPQGLTPEGRLTTRSPSEAIQLAINAPISADAYARSPSAAPSNRDT